MQLFKHLVRNSKSSYLRPQFALASVQGRGFSAGAVPSGDQTSLADVADVFKVNYTVEYEQGLSDE